MSLSFRLIALAVIFGAVAIDAGYSPLCPKKLTTSKARFKCYSKVIRNLYEGIYHVNFADLQASSQVFVPWMEPDIQGRSSAGAFNGVALNAEYLAVAFPTFVVFGDHSDFPKITYFTSSNKVAAFSADFLMSAPALGTIANWTIWGYARFSDNNLLSHYDVDFRRYGEFLEALGTTQHTPEALLEQQTYLSSFICNATMKNCVGPLQQYASYEACMEYNIPNPFIAPTGRIPANCQLCRVVHTTLLPFNVNLHCYHVGPSGPNNSACTNDSYSAYYTFFKDSVWISNPNLMD